MGAVGLGFEPSLTDPESVSALSWLFAVVQKTAYLSQIPGSRVSHCSPLFTPVTVKSLSIGGRGAQFFRPAEAGEVSTLPYETRLHPLHKEVPAPVANPTGQS